MVLVLLMRLCYPARAKEEEVISQRCFHELHKYVTNLLSEV